jgi:hypothetical protein
LLDEGKDPLEGETTRARTGHQGRRCGDSPHLVEKYYKAKIAKKSRSYRKSPHDFRPHRKTIGDMPVTGHSCGNCDQAAGKVGREARVRSSCFPS